MISLWDISIIWLYLNNRKKPLFSGREKCWCQLKDRCITTMKHSKPCDSKHKMRHTCCNGYDTNNNKKCLWFKWRACKHSRQIFCDIVWAGSIIRLGNYHIFILESWKKNNEGYFEVWDKGIFAWKQKRK